MFDWVLNMPLVQYAYKNTGHFFKNGTKTQNSKSLFQQILIVHKTFTVGIKTKNLPRRTRFGLWLFYKGVL